MLRTRLGRSIRATANHRFLAFEGWRRLDELEMGTRIALPRRLDTWSDGARTMSDPELALLGHLIGDGCTLSSQTMPSHAVQYTTCEPELAALVADLAEQVFGDTIRPRVKPERSWYQVYLSAARHLTHGVRNPIAAWLDSLGAFGLRSFEKRVPDEVFRQPSEGIAVFLRHLWATDGTLVSRGMYPAIRFDSTSEVLTRDVQSLLLRLGINGRRREVPMPGKGRSSHRVDVSGQEDVLRLLTTVGAVGTRRCRVAAEIERRILDVRGKTNRDVIPREAWKTLVVPAMAAAGMTARELNSALGRSPSNAMIGRGGISRHRPGSIADAIDCAELRNLATSEVYWDEVLSIEPDGEDEVFDLTVDGLHNFVAEDIVLHNSLEQDSDLVFFVYRDEYYLGEESDQQGIAEVILAKHRNGPTGTIKLSFLRRYAKFADLAAA
jgi:replicative DNA helicase